MSRDYSCQRGCGATRCYGCLCDTCANSVELLSWYFTPGETATPCFSCDECRQYDGDRQKPDQWTSTCPRYIEAKKAAEARTIFEDKRAKTIRRTFRVIEGGKE